MPNIAVVLREEIQRLSRKEIRNQVGPLKKQVLSLKKQVRQQREQIARLEQISKKVLRFTGGAAAAVPVTEADGGKSVRVSEASVRRHRERLRLTQVELGRLLGVTPITIGRWESGQASPRGASRAAFAEVRKLGLKEARMMLESLVEG